MMLYTMFVTNRKYMHQCVRAKDSIAKYLHNDIGLNSDKRK